MSQHDIQITVLVDNTTSRSERLAATATALSKHGLSLLRPAHCTGVAAAAYLAEHTTCATRPSNVGEGLTI